MKKIINYIVITLLLFSVASCDKTDELNENVSGYYSFSVSFLPEGSETDYTIIFNDSEVKSDGYVSRKNSTGKLEIFRKGSTTPEFSKEVTITENNEIIKLIKVGEQPLDIYNADNYASFKPVVLFQEGQDENYQIRFNGIDLKNRTTNYLPKNDLTGTLEILKKEEITPLLIQDITIEPESQLNFMQLSESDFLFIPENNESAPESKQYTKVRFFYTQNDFPQSKNLKLTIFLTDKKYKKFHEAYTLFLKPGEISEYILIDHFYFSENFIRGVYDLIDVDTNTKIVNNEKHTKTELKFGKNSSSEDGGYQFETIRFTDATGLGGNNVRSNDIPELRTEW